MNKVHVNFSTSTWTFYEQQSIVNFYELFRTACHNYFVTCNAQYYYASKTELFCYFNFDIFIKCLADKRVTQISNKFLSKNQIYAFQKKIKRKWPAWLHTNLTFCLENPTISTGKKQFYLRYWHVIIPGQTNLAQRELALGQSRSHTSGSSYI